MTTNHYEETVKRIRSKFLSVSREILRTSPPVSYTHLDVYKRQICKCITNYSSENNKIFKVPSRQNFVSSFVMTDKFGIRNDRSTIYITHNTPHLPITNNEQFSSPLKL